MNSAYFDASDWLAQNEHNLASITDLEAPYSLSTSEMTPLEMAAITHRRDVVEKLIALGARTEELDTKLLHTGWDIEDIIAFCYHPLPSRSRESIPEFDVLQRIVLRCDEKLLCRLLDLGGDPNCYKTWEHSGNETVVYTLLEDAVSQSSVECVELLLSRGAKMTPDIARRGLYSYAKTFLLLTLGVPIEVNARNVRGETPFWEVCSGWYRGEDRTALISLMINLGAKVNVADNENGVTPLMFASATGDLEMMSLLLKAGADLQIRDKRDLTALDFAQARRQTKAIEMLQKAAAGELP